MMGNNKKARKKEINEQGIDMESKIRIDLQREGGCHLAEAASPVNS